MIDEIIKKVILDISKELCDLGIEETDTELIEDIAREIKVILG